MAKQTKDKTKKKFPKKQKIFIEEYLVDFNATRSAEAAGYSNNGANQACYLLMINVDVRNEIERRIKERRKLIQVDQFYVINKAKKIVEAEYFNSVIIEAETTQEAIDSVPDHLKAFMTGFEIIEKSYGVGEYKTTTKSYKFKFMSKDKALGMLGRHTGADKITHDVGDNLKDVKKSSDKELITKLGDLVKGDLSGIFKLTGLSDNGEK